MPLGSFRHATLPDHKTMPASLSCLPLNVTPGTDSKDREVHRELPLAGIDSSQGFMQNKIFSSYTIFDGHMDINSYAHS